REYDALGRLKDLREGGENPDRSDIFLRKSTYVYDGAGNLIAQTNGVGSGRDDGLATKASLTVYAYDAFGRMTAVTEAANDTTPTNPAGQPTEDTLLYRRTTRYRYDAADNRVLVIDPYGAETQMTYDSFNRVVRTVEAANRVGVLWFEGGGRTTTVVYDALGNVRWVERPRGQSADAGATAT